MRCSTVVVPPPSVRVCILAFLTCGQHRIPYLHRRLAFCLQALNLVLAMFGVGSFFIPLAAQVRPGGEAVAHRPRAAPLRHHPRITTPAAAVTVLLGRTAQHHGSFAGHLHCSCSCSCSSQGARSVMSLLTQSLPALPQTPPCRAARRSWATPWPCSTWWGQPRWWQLHLFCLCPHHCHHRPSWAATGPTPLS